MKPTMGQHGNLPLLNGLPFPPLHIRLAVLRQQHRALLARPLTIPLLHSPHFPHRGSFDDRDLGEGFVDARNTKRFNKLRTSAGRPQESMRLHERCKPSTIRVATFVRQLGN